MRRGRYPFLIDYRRDGTFLDSKQQTRSEEVNMLPIDAENRIGVSIWAEKSSVSRALTVNPGPNPMQTFPRQVLLPHKVKTGCSIQKLARIRKQILSIIRQYCQ